MRRVVWAACLAAACCSAQERLDVVGNLGQMATGYLTALAQRHWERRAEQVERIRSRAEVEERQAYIRARILESLGGLPEKTPLNARLTGTLARDGYRVEKVVFESQPRFYVPANVYVPTGGKPPFPAVLGTSGHFANGIYSSVQQRVWISLAKRGILVLAFDPPGQGERMQYYDPALGKSRVGIATVEHTRAGIQCLLTGTNLARYIVWDGIRAIDYLLTRPDVDPKRLGVTGVSGGGMQTAYLAAVEPRLAAAAPSCYITRWRQLWAGTGPQDAEQNLAGLIAAELDFADYLIAFAPRPMKVLTATRDFFPIEGARATFAEARRIYEVLGRPERIEFFEADTTHGWQQPRREATYRWFDQWLAGAAASSPEPSFETEPEENLHVTATGVVSTSLGGETVQSLNRAEAERLYSRRGVLRAKDPAALRQLVAARLGISGELPGTVKATAHGELGRDGYRIEKLALDTEPGIVVPALLLVPPSAGGRRPAVLYLNSEGKSADAGPGGDMEALARAGYIVMAPDPRGWGESADPRQLHVYRGPWQLSMRAVLLGKTLPGMQVADVLRCIDYLAARPEVDAARIAVFGKGHGGVLAQFAAALDPRIRKVAAERAVLSYMSVVRATLHEDLADLIVPGILRDFDLPDLAQAIRPRKLWLISPANPVGARRPLPEAAKEYEDAGRQSWAGFRIATRPEGWPFERVYRDWLPE